MLLVKVNQDIFQVISREQNHVVVITKEREVKRVEINQIKDVNWLDIQRNLKELRKNRIVYLPQYRKIKRYNFN